MGGTVVDGYNNSNSIAYNDVNDFLKAEFMAAIQLSVLKNPNPLLLLKSREEKFEILSKDMKKHLAKSFGLNTSDKFILELFELYKNMIDFNFGNIKKGTRNISKITNTIRRSDDENYSYGFRCLAKKIVQHNIDLRDDIQAKENISNLFDERLRDKNFDFVNSLLHYSRKIKMEQLDSLLIK